MHGLSNRDTTRVFHSIQSFLIASANISKIFWPEDHKWLPYNLNNGPHDCKNNGKETKQEITLEMVQKKLESLGIIINIERLMKQ